MKEKRTKGQRKKKKIFRKQKTNCQGMTMIELIITFALMVLFALGTIQLLSVSMKVYYQIRDLNNARQVSDTLMDKITGELEGAQVGMQYEIDNGITLRIYDQGTAVELFDRTGSPIVITTENQYLLIRYKKVQTYEEVNWTFDEKSYMGFQIESLIFQRADENEYPPNVIRIDMTLSSERYGSFDVTRYVECYNFTTSRDFNRIEDEDHPREKEPETEQPETEAPQPETETESETESETETESKKETESETKPETETQSETQSESETETEAIEEPENPENKKYIELTGHSGLFAQKKATAIRSDNYAELIQELLKSPEDIIRIPMGLYTDGQKYYVVPSDILFTKADFMRDTSIHTIEGLYRKYKSQNRCLLFTNNKEVSGSSLASSVIDLRINEGEILNYGGKYYLCKKSVTVSLFTNPSNGAVWYDITTFVK